MIATDPVGRFSTTLPPLPHSYDRVQLEQMMRDLRQEINALAQAVWLLTDGAANGDRTTPGGTSVTTPHTVEVDAENGKRFTNKTATHDVLINLPAATTSQEYEFAVDIAHDIFLWPSLGEKFQLGTAYFPMQLTGIGTLVRIGCMADGTWRVIRQIGTAPVYTTGLLLNPDYTPILDVNYAPIINP